MSNTRIDPSVYAGLDPETKALVDAELAKYEQVITRNPLQAVTMYPKQRQFLENRSFLKGFIGGNGTGKSTIGTVDDIIQVCDSRMLPKALREFKRWDPPVHLRVAAPDDGVLESTVLPKFRELMPKDAFTKGSFDRAYSGQHRKLTLKNGSWILFNTFKQDRDSWAGVEVRRTRFDEEPPGQHGFDLYTESVARLRRWTPDAQIVFTMTPLLGLTWVSDLFEREDSWRVTAGIRDNPYLADPEAVIRSLSHLSELEKRAVIEGEFVHFGGAVVYVRDENLVDPITPNFLIGKDVYVGIDPGIRRAGVVWASFDRDNSMLVFDEYYPENATVETISDYIKERNLRWNIREPIYIIDPTARNRSLVNAQSVEAEFANHGIYCCHGQNDRRAGILQLRGRLENGGLFITKNCEKLLWESKRWLVASDEVQAEQRAKVKGEGGTFATIGPDHLWDPTRYIAQERLVYTIPQGNGPPVGKFIERGLAVPARLLHGPAGPVPPMGAMS